MNLNQNRQELFRDVFRIKSGPRDLIFEYKNKHKLDHLSQKLRTITLFVGTKKGKTFKSYNDAIAKYGAPLWYKPVKNRNHLYLILRDYIMLSKSLRDGIYSDSAVVNESCDFFLKKIVRILINQNAVKSDYLGKIELCEKFNLYTKSILTYFDSDSDYSDIDYSDGDSE